MIVQCPACKELVQMLEFSVDGQTLRFDCQSCGKSQSVTSKASKPPAPKAEAEPAPSASPPAAAPVAAPASASAQTIMFQPSPFQNVSKSPAATSQPGKARSPVAQEPLPDMPPPAQVEATGPQAALWMAWNKLVQDWWRHEAHEAFVAVCGAAESLAFAGTRYRERLTAHPKDPMATKGRDRVLAQAMALAQSQTKDPVTSQNAAATKRYLNIAVIVFLVVVGAVAVNSVMSSVAAVKNGASQQ